MVVVSPFFGQVTITDLSLLALKWTNMSSVQVNP